MKRVGLPKLENADAFDLEIWVGNLTHDQVESLMQEWMEQIHSMKGATAMSMSVAKDAKKVK